MATSNPNEPTYTDLSHLTKGLTGQESQAATNTVSAPPPFTAPGSVSESTASEAVGDPTLDVGSQTDYLHRP